MKNEKFYKTNPSGISLIVLVITIIVIIILAAAVILTLNKNNPIEEANKARYESDVASIQAIFTNTVTKVMAQNQSTIEVKAGELNSVKIAENEINSVEGRVSYKLDNPQDESKKEGTIIFNIGTNNATTYYTGRMLPLYSAGKTTWYVDSEGVISLEVGEQKYGNGIKIEEPTEPVTPPTSPKEEIEITQSDTPVIREYVWMTSLDFHATPYNNKITKVKFALADKVSENSIKEWDISKDQNKSVMAWIEDDGLEGYILTIAGKNKIMASPGANYLFYGMNNVESVENIELLNIENTTNIEGMFYGLRKVTKLDLSNWNMSNVINTNRMFMNCSNLTTTINIIDNKIERYLRMFYEAATESSAQITVNYTAETSDLVDKMIATKSEKSNIVKGKQL